MLKYVLPVLALTTASIVVNAQTPTPPITIRGNGYTQTTPFVAFRESSADDLLIAFGVRQEGGVKTNILLYAHQANNYKAYLDDSAANYVDLEIDISRKNARGSWLDEDFVRLQRAKLQPSSTIKGFVLAFDIPDSIITDMRGRELSKFTYTVEQEGTNYVSSGGYSVAEKAGKMFAAYLLKIPAGKSWFEPITSFAKNKIPLASLFHQSPEYIKGVLGAPVKDTNRNGTIYVRHITRQGTYEIEYADNMAIDIHLYPAYRFYPTRESQTPENTPFEIVPRAGENYPGKTTSCAHTATFPKRLRMASYVRTERGRERDVEGRRYIAHVEMKEEI